MLSLNAQDFELLQSLREELGHGDSVTAGRWAEIAKLQPHFAQVLGITTDTTSTQWEQFALVRDQVDAEPFIGPRWWFHITGLRHGSVHVVLTTPQGWFIVQRRSFAKDDNPGAIDIAVTGHTGTSTPLDGAWREMAEEIGLQRAMDNEAPSIVSNTLNFFCTFDFGSDNNHQNPPHLNRERVWVYHGKVTTEGMGRLRFTDGEVTALLLLGPVELASIAIRCQLDQPSAPGELNLAWGLRRTLPRWISAISSPQ